MTHNVIIQPGEDFDRVFRRWSLGLKPGDQVRISLATGQQVAMLTRQPGEQKVDVVHNAPTEWTPPQEA